MGFLQHEFQIWSYEQTMFHLLVTIFMIDFGMNVMSFDNDSEKENFFENVHTNPFFGICCISTAKSNFCFAKRNSIDNPNWSKTQTFHF